MRTEDKQAGSRIGRTMTVWSDGAKRQVVAWRRPLVVALHVALFAASYWLAWALRFDFRIPARDFELMLLSVSLLLLLRSLAFWHYRLFEGMWRYAGVRDLVSILKATTLSSLAFVAIAFFAWRSSGFPRSIFLIDWGLVIFLTGGARMAIRVLRESRYAPGTERRRAIVVGAGDAGEGLVRESWRNPGLGYEVVGFVDDDPSKQRIRIHGIGVLGTTDELPAVCAAHGVEDVLIAVPSASGDEYRRIVAVCKAAGVAYRTVPPLMDLVSGRARLTQLGTVGPEELLARDAVEIDVETLRATHQGKIVLVTGAGGSIGSELCRQIAMLEPARLVLLERAESALYLMQRELERRHPTLEVVPVVGDVCDREKTEQAVAFHLPDVVYHAAAYKHVPLMETHPLEAIQNNVVGTRILAEAAARAGVRRFVLISTDKAVRPVGVMGMTKRVAECVLQSMGPSDTVFSAVRFGNVLGSDGSVLPLFRSQIAAGGPVTVTDADASRYFMLISEAALLVMQAGAMGRGGEVFFLEMGEPVRIYDLAENLIRMAGMRPGAEIPIEITGLRPGERLAEELYYESEELAPSEHEKIRVVRNGAFDVGSFRDELAALEALVAAGDADTAASKLRLMAERF